jgi:tetratricopeptide (TPR) repeat protein
MVAVCFAGPSEPQDVDTRVDRLYQEARNEEKQGRDEIAIQRYQEMIRLSPNLPAAYNNLGRLYYRQNRMEEAIKTLKRALELDAKLAPSRALLGFSYYEVGDVKNAREALTAALELNPGDRKAGLYLARCLFDLDDYEGAFQVLNKLQHADPKNPDVLYLSGLVHMKWAEATLGELQKVAPGSYLIEVLLGKYAEAKEGYPDAIEHYKRALAKNPDGSGLHYLLAHALWASGGFQDALPEYKRALELNPYDYDASWEMAKIVLSDNPEEAYLLANRALELKPGIPQALTIRGRALLALKKPKDAIEDLKKASALDKEDATIHLQLGRAYRQVGLTQEAQAEMIIYERMEKEAHAPKVEQVATPR